MLRVPWLRLLLAGFHWLLLLFLADAKEREKLYIPGVSPTILPFGLYAVLCLSVLLHGFQDAESYLLSAPATSFETHFNDANDAANSRELTVLVLSTANWLFLVLSWQQFWQAHRFATATFCAFGALFAALALWILSGAAAWRRLAWLFGLALHAMQTLYFQRRFGHMQFGARDLGRLETPVLRTNANGFILPQNPDLFVINSMESQKVALQEAVGRMLKAH
jgi:hypothetical protein